MTKYNFQDIWNYSDKTSKGNRVFLDLKKSGKLKIAFSKPLANGSYDKEELLIPEDVVADLCSKFNAIRPKQSILQQPTKAYTLDEKRKEVGKDAYTPWTDADDKELSTLHKLGFKNDQLAQRFKRSRGAIESRIKKLGL